MTVESQAAAGLRWGGISKLGSQLASWAATLAVVRMLSPDDFGLMALCMVVITTFAGFAEFGLGSSLVQTAKLATKDLPRVAGAILVFNVGAAIVTTASAPLIAHLLGDERLTALLRTLSLLFLFPAIETVPYAIAHRGMKFRRLAIVEFSVTLIGSFATVLLAWRGAGVWALVYGALASAALRTILYVSLGGFVRPSFDARGIGPLMRFGGIITVTRLLWLLTSQTDILIAGRLFVSEIVGVYSLSMDLANLPLSKVMAIINQVALPTVARLQGDLARVRKQLLRSLRLLAAVVIPAMWGLSSVSHEFVDVILGERWHDASLPLQLVSFVTPLRMFQAVFATALTGIGRADLEFRNTIVAALVLPAAFLIGGQRGLAGLAWSWLPAVPFVCALNFPRTLQAFGIGWGDLAAAVKAPVLAGGLMYAVVSIARPLMLQSEEWQRLVVLVVAGAAAYLITVAGFDRSIWLDVRRFATSVRG